jgi:hypothetical protein
MGGARGLVFNGSALAHGVLYAGMDIGLTSYLVLAVLYGLSTIRLARQGWGGRKLRGRVVPFPGRRPRFAEDRRNLAHAS